MSGPKTGELLPHRQFSSRPIAASPQTTTVPTETTADTAIAKTNLKINNWQTKNNVNVFFVEARELPMVDIRLTFRAGAAYEAKKPGVAALTNAMLNEGTKTYTNDQISEIFESIGAIFSAGVDKDSASISLRSLSEPQKLEQGLTVFHDLIANPAFPAKNFNRVKNQAIESLKLNQQYPEVISNNEFYKLIYQNHPYAIPAAGTIESVNTLTPTDLSAFFNKFYTDQNAQITIVGDLSTSDAKNISEKIAAHLKAGVKVPELPLVEINKSVTNTKHIDFPSTQTHILLGAIGIKRNDPDYFALTLGNHVLGNIPLTSLLFKNVRINQGLAYSVSSSFSTMQNEGPFLINMQTRNEKASEALSVSKNTLDDFLKNGPTEQELTIAKQNLTGQFPINISSNSKKLNIVSSIGFYNLPLDYLDTYVANINKITQQDIITAFNKHLNMNNLTVVTVGNSQQTSNI